MRVIAGKSGGIPLAVPKTITRPTTDRVREAVFSSLGDLVDGARVLDLFAGTGSLGIEALSRGADSVVFVEENRAVTAVISENLKKTGLEENATIRQTAVLSFFERLGEAEKFDLIFADPPYARDEETKAALADLLFSKKLSQALAPDGIFILESFAREQLPALENWESLREKKYGDTRVSFLRQAIQS